MKKHKHHIKFKSQGGTDDASNIEELNFIEHAIIHANDSIENGTPFDFRHEGYKYLPLGTQLKLRELTSQRMRENNPMHNPDVAKVSGSKRKGIPTGNRHTDENRIVMSERMKRENPMRNASVAKKVSETQRENGLYEAHSERMKNNNPMKNPDTAKKVSDAKKGKPSNRKGCTLSEKTKQKISEAKKGSKHTEEAKAKMSAARKGVKRGPYKRKK